MRVEARSGLFATGHPIVISGHDRVVKAADNFDAFIWVRAIADQVAQTPDPIERHRRRNHGVEGFQVCVNVRND